VVRKTEATPNTLENQNFIFMASRLHPNAIKVVGFAQLPL
jgi:hypothetical protein